MALLTCTVRGLPLETTRQMVENNFNLTIHHESPCAASAVVDESQGSSCSTTVTFRKERKGKKRSCETLQDHFNGSKFRGQSSTISVASDFLGLTPLSGSRTAPIHLYFAHGLGGHAFRTWCSDGDDDIERVKAWPRDFLPKRLSSEGIDARIYTLGYNANTVRNPAPNATITSTAEDLLAALIAERSVNSPQEIYFICHSLGGLVVCQALVLAIFEDEQRPNKASYRNLFWRNDECLVKGILFMGTPFLGSGHANLLAPFVRAVKGLNFLSATNDRFIKSLKENNESLEVATIVQRFQVITEKTKMRLLVGCEEQPIAGSNLTITYESACSIFKDTATPFRIHSDHRGMVKFDDPHQADYMLLENLIVKMIRPLVPEEAGQKFPVPQSQPAFAPPANPTGLGYSGFQPEALPGLQFNFFNNMQEYHKPYGESSHGQHHSPEDLVHPQNISFRPFNSSDNRTRNQTLPHRHAPIRPSPNQTTSYPETNVVGVPKPRTINVAQRSSTDTQLLHHNADDSPWNRLKMFDTVFIVDDTGSMIKKVKENEPEGLDRWTVTVEALRHIADIAAEHDEDGIDMKFLKMDEFDAENIISGAAISDILSLIDFQNQDHGGGTTFAKHLEGVIDSHVDTYEDYIDDLAVYRQRVRERAKKPKRPDKPKALNVIVITDGQADDEEEVENYIIKVARKLDQLEAPAGHIGIQFVQVGDDEQATTFLKRLDDDLKKIDPPVRDIVDTTPYRSGIEENATSFHETLRKVLLGAVTRKIDEQDNDSIPSG